MNNQEIDDLVRRQMGWSGHPHEEPVKKDIEQIGPGILELLAEIAKRLPDPEQDDTETENNPLKDLAGKWEKNQPDRAGERVPIQYGSPIPVQEFTTNAGPPPAPIITAGNQIRMSLRLPIESGPSWEDFGRLLKVLGYSYIARKLDHEIRVTLTKEPLF